MLHDIGKLGIPDGILHKEGRLSPDEWSVMRDHPRIGARMLESTEALHHLSTGVAAEHERWDGTGYPAGLTGDQIPVASRIVLACNAYDAMTTDRPYRPAMDPAAARAELRAGAGTQFDPRVIQALLRVLDGGG